MSGTRKSPQHKKLWCGYLPTYLLALGQTGSCPEPLRPVEKKMRRNGSAGVLCRAVRSQNGNSGSQLTDHPEGEKHEQETGCGGGTLIEYD